MKIHTDVDIDMGNREQLLSIIEHIPASMRKVKPIRKHASGVYITDIPYDPAINAASIDYADAEERGYFKLDLLNVHVYEHVKNEEHLIELMKEPDWSMLKDKTIVDRLIHLNNSYYLIQRMPEPIDSIPRLAMFLATIRPSKKHLIGLTWREINDKVWDKDEDGYTFKKSHAVAYAQLVVVHMNLIKENPNLSIEMIQ